MPLRDYLLLKTLTDLFCNVPLAKHVLFHVELTFCLKPHPRNTAQTSNHPSFRFLMMLSLYFSLLCTSPSIIFGTTGWDVFSIKQIWFQLSNWTQIKKKKREIQSSAFVQWERNPAFRNNSLTSKDVFHNYYSSPMLRLCAAPLLPRKRHLIFYDVSQDGRK